MVDLPDGSYQFKTDYGLVYAVYFTEASGYFSNYPDFSQDVLMFGFDVRFLPLLRIPNDERVQTTISSIISAFFARNPRKILFFFCDTTDRRERSRMRTFENWYRSGNDAAVEKLNEEIQAGDHYFYGSVLLLRDHLLKHQIAAAFRQLRMELQDKLTD